MRVLTYIPKDRRMTRGEWKKIDRWCRAASRVVERELQKDLEHLMIFGMTPETAYLLPLKESPQRV